MNTAFYMYPARVRRFALGLSQSELAKRAGVSPTSVVKIERGAKMRPSVAHKIMTELGFTEQELQDLTSNIL